MGDFEIESDKQLINQLFEASEDIRWAKKQFEGLLKYTRAGTDIHSQSYYQIEYLEKLSSLIPKNKCKLWFIYKYRPQKKHIQQINTIVERMKDSRRHVLDYWDADSKKIGDTSSYQRAIKYKSEALGCLNLDIILRIPSVLHTLEERHGSYDSYFSRRVHRIVDIAISSVIASLVAAIIGLYVR